MAKLSASGFFTVLSTTHWESKETLFDQIRSLPHSIPYDRPVARGGLGQCPPSSRWSQQRKFLNASRGGKKVNFVSMSHFSLPPPSILLTTVLPYEVFLSVKVAKCRVGWEAEILHSNVVFRKQIFSNGQTCLASRQISKINTRKS